jgi:hypothetical protein
MNYKYALTKTTYYNGEHTRTSYGIAAISTEDNLTVLCSVEDIADEQGEIENLVEICNVEKLAIEHLQNVVEDLLCVNE